MSLFYEKSKGTPIEQKPEGPLIKDFGTKPMSDEESLLGDEYSSLHRVFLNQTSFSIEGVRFTPKIIEFIDVFEGKQSSVNFAIRNVGTKPVMVRMGKPKSFIFQLKKEIRRVKLLPPGCSIKRTITYVYHNDDIVERSMIPVEINGRLVDYPIVVKKAVPEIEVIPTKLDFEVINLGAMSKTMILTILNTGGKRTRFKIDVCKNNLKLVVQPTRGTIRAKSKVKVDVEVVGLQEGEFYSEIWITSDEMPVRVPVLIEVLRPRLEIAHPNKTDDFTLIDFQPTFIGTQTVDSFLLKNRSAEPTYFVTLAEVNGNFQFWKDAQKAEKTFDMFKITAEEGRLEAFETRIVTVLFKPKTIVHNKGWSHEKNETKKKRDCEHIVFFRIKRIHGKERSDLAQLELISSQNKTEEKGDMFQFAETTKISNSTNILQELNMNLLKDTDTCFLDPSLETLRVCLYGEAVEPDIILYPSNLDFECLTVGESKKKVITVTNQNKIAIKYKFPKVMNLEVKPKEGWLNPKEVLEFLVVLTSTCAGQFKTKITLEIFAKSQVVFEKDKDLAKIREITVPVQYRAELLQTLPVPKIGLGITPMVTDEVGFLKEQMTFKSDFKKPYAAMLLSLTEKFKPEWMRNEPDKEKNVDNAIIAFPNDRQYNLRWPHEKICRTIFQGLFRYSPPEDLRYTFTCEEWKERKRHKTMWTNYLEFLRQLRQISHPYLEKDLTAAGGEEQNCGPNFELMPMVNNTQLQKSLFQSRQENSWGEITPLSSVCLEKISVRPKIINFCAVAADIATYETLTITNKNSFEIYIQFVPGRYEMDVVPSDSIRVPPGATRFAKVYIQTKDFGPYFGSLSYTINGSHTFKLTAFALITSKTLHLSLNDLTVDFKNYSKNSFFVRSKFITLWNFLQFPVKYRWNFPWDSSFFVEPIEGEIPPRAKILSELFFCVDPKKPFFSELKIISESNNTEVVKATHLDRNPPVSFTTHVLDLEEIPLNLLTKVKPIVRNACYHDVAFKVIDWKPMPGVLVAPRQGVLKSRSFFPLDVEIQIPIIMKFSFEIALLIHLQNRISIKIRGKVALPLIRIRPADIIMPRICAGSFGVVTMCVENEGRTPAEVAFDFKDCPEYKIAEDKTKIYLPENKSSKVVIYFHPKDVSRYVFYLPIIINSILGPPVMQERQTEFLSYFLAQQEEVYQNYGQIFQSRNSNFKIPCVIVNSSVSPAILKISSLNVVFRPNDDSSLEFQSQEIEFSNEFVRDATFCIRTDDLENTTESPFSLVPREGSVVEYRTKSIKARLKQHEKLFFEAKFEPSKPGVYCVSIPIYVKGYNNGAVFNYINLKGELKEPRLNSEYSEIHIPPLPLGVACEANFSVFAENYRFSSTIHCFLYDLNKGAGSPPDCLSTSWVSEPKINNNPGVQIFRLKIRFQSLVPIALRSYIVLLDSKGGYCTILVTATSDNSAITTHAFLTTTLTQSKLFRYLFLPPTPNVGEKTNFSRSPESFIATDFSRDAKKKKSIQSLLIEGASSDMSSMHKEQSWSLDSKWVRHVSSSRAKLNRVSFLDGTKSSASKTEENTSSTLLPSKSKVFNFISFNAESSLGAKALSALRQYEAINDMTYPNFPTQETAYSKHFQATLIYVERWIYEVVMRCNLYFLIPITFQEVDNIYEKPLGKGKHNKAKNQNKKGFVDFLAEFFGSNIRSLIQSHGNQEFNSPLEKAKFLHSFYAQVLQFLSNQYCLLPHVKPEHLLDYENYLLYVNDQNVESFTLKSSEGKTSKIVKKPHVVNKSDRDFKNKESAFSLSFQESWKKDLLPEIQLESEIDIFKVEGSNQESDVALRSMEDEAFVDEREFVHESKILDAISFDLRSTQAWLDVLIQIFKNFYLNRTFLEDTIPHATKVKMSDSLIVESVVPNWSSIFEEKCTHILGECDCIPPPPLTKFESNFFTNQESALLNWLNFNLSKQRHVLWSNESSDSKQSPRVVTNFDRDLADSIALIAVTAAHCPYIAHEFSDVFPVADTLNKIFHNAGRLIAVWRILNFSLTVEAMDIVKPNPLFMVMLVAHLYDVLPSLHPGSVVCFSAPLTTEVTRIIQVINHSSQSLVYHASFFGDFEGFFRLKESSKIEVKPSSIKKLKIIFTARKIQKVSATLVLFGAVVSPNFARNLTFYLEGIPSAPLVSKQFMFAVPLYEILCKEIVLNPPYSEPTTYEIWYTTKKPVFREDIDDPISAKPWSEIKHRKVARRLFLNTSSVTSDENEKSVTLSLTVACLTMAERSFWLIFRSDTVGDFIIRILVRAKLTTPKMTINGFYSESWSPDADCLCPEGGRNSKIFVSNAKDCPCLTELSIPARNESLWQCLNIMFHKTLNAQEKSFWTKHFETNTGFCLILWLLGADEEKEVIDEFIHIFQTQVTYTLMIKTPNEQHVTIPDRIEIRDVREKTKIQLPIHISKEALPNLKLVLTMTSESGKEIRKFNVSLFPPEKGRRLTKERDDETTFSRSVCQPPRMEAGKEFCRGDRK